MAVAYDVIVCGNLHFDIVVNAPALQRLDETVVGSNWKKICGGKGGNQAMHSARAGARTAMVGRTGSDRMTSARLCVKGWNTPEWIRKACPSIPMQVRA